MKVSYEETVIISLKLLVLLNFADLLSTMILFELSMIREGNPLMNYFLMTDAFLFSIAKLTLLYAGVIILYIHRKLPLTSCVSIAMTMFYCLIVAKHIWIISTIRLA